MRRSDAAFLPLLRTPLIIAEVTPTSEPATTSQPAVTAATPLRLLRRFYYAELQWRLEPLYSYATHREESAALAPRPSRFATLRLKRPVLAGCCHMPRQLATPRPVRRRHDGDR